MKSLILFFLLFISCESGPTSTTMPKTSKGVNGTCEVKK